MAQPFKPSPLARQLLGLLRQAVATDNGDGIAPLSHRLPIKPPGSDVPVTFTVNLIPDERGTFLVTCRELPDITSFGRDEEEALEMAEESIREALSGGRGAPDFPY